MLTVFSVAGTQGLYRLVTVLHPRRSYAPNVPIEALW